MELRNLTIPNKSKSNNLIPFQEVKDENLLSVYVIRLICSFLKDSDFYSCCKGVNNKLIQKNLMLRLNTLKYYVFTYTDKNILEVFNLLSKYPYPDYSIDLKNKILSNCILVFALKEVIFQSIENKSLVRYNISLERIEFQYNFHSKITLMIKISDLFFAAVSMNELKIFHVNFPNSVACFTKLNNITAIDYELSSHSFALGFKDGTVKCINLFTSNNETSITGNLKELNSLSLFTDYLKKNADFEINEKTFSMITSIKFISMYSVITVNCFGFIYSWNLKKSTFHPIIKFEYLNKLTKTTIVKEKDKNFCIFKTQKNIDLNIEKDELFGIYTIEKISSGNYCQISTVVKKKFNIVLEYQKKL